MFSHTLSDGVELHLLQPYDRYIDSFHGFLMENRDFLGEWLGWAHTLQTREQVKAQVERVCKRNAEGNSLSLCIFVDDVYAGGLVLNINSREHNIGEIGYWLGEAYTGRGIITQGTRFMINFGFEMFKLNRIIIRCATGNTKSQAIPKRLNFTREALQRAGYLLNNVYHDMIIYSLLAEEWQR